jgi:O-antigen/teichoic acid export membrane protein
MSNWRSRSVWSVADNFSQQALSFVIFALLARILTPHEFGLLAIAHLIVQFVRITILDAFAMPVVRGSDSSESDNSLLNWLFSLCTLVSAVLAGVMALLSPLLANFFSAPELIPVLIGMSLVIVLYGLVRSHEARLLREGNFRLLAIRSIISVCAGGAVALLMAFQGAGAMALVAQQLTTGVVALLIAVLAEWREWRPRWYWSTALIRTHSNEIIKVGTTALLNYAKNNIDVVIVSVLLGSFATGLYNLAKRVLSAVFLVIGASLGRVGITKFVQEKSDLSALLQSYTRMLGLIFLLMVPIYSLVTALAVPMITVVFGEQWVASAPLFGWLSIAYLGQTAFELGQNLSFATGMSGRVSKMALKQLLISTVAALLFGQWWGITGVVTGFALGSLFGMIEMQRSIGNQLVMPFRRFALTLLPACTGSLMIFAMVKLLPLAAIKVTGWLSLVAVGTLGLFFYSATAIFIGWSVNRFSIIKITLPRI